MERSWRWESWIGCALVACMWGASRGWGVARFPNRATRRALTLSLKNLLEALSDTYSTANFDFSSTGCELQAMDTNKVALVVVFLPKDLFNDYHCCDRGLSMGLNLTYMAAVFRGGANDDDVITVEAYDDFSNTVTFTFSPKDGEIIWSIDFDLVCVDDVPFEIPKPSESAYLAVVRMPSAKFMRICEELSSVGDRWGNDRDRDAMLLSLSRWRSVSASSLVEKMGPKKLCAARSKLMVSQKNLPLWR